MANIEDNSYNNFYDSELIVEFLQGLLPGDLHLKIQEQIEGSEMFRTYVEGVQINFEKSGKDREKMEATIAEKKARTLQQLKRETTLGEKLSYTLAQLQAFFLPNPQLELALQPTRMTGASASKIAIDNATEILTLNLGKTTTEVIDFELFDNKIQSIEKHKIPANVKDFTLSISSFHPGIYYAQLSVDDATPYIVRFYIREDLNPE